MLMVVDAGVVEAADGEEKSSFRQRAKREVLGRMRRNRSLACLGWVEGKCMSALAFELLHQRRPAI